MLVWIGMLGGMPGEGAVGDMGEVGEVGGMAEGEVAEGGVTEADEGVGEGVDGGVDLGRRNMSAVNRPL